MQVRRRSRIIALAAAVACAGAASAADRITGHGFATRSEVHAPDLGVSLGPMKFLDYLMERSGQAVLLDRADACLVNLPDPARYGLHKLIVAHERGPRNPKHDKDIAQALALIEWHLQRAPHALADAWNDLAGRGAGWVKRARASLALAPPAHADIVLRFDREVVAGR